MKKFRVVEVVRMREKKEDGTELLKNRKGKVLDRKP
jgi:hypothetical protein